MESASLNIPKPIFVLTDIYSDSYTTALNVIQNFHSSNYNNNNNKNINNEKSTMQFLLCGTNDGVINVWSFSTYRIQCHIKLAKIAGIDQKDVSRINSIASISNRKILSQLHSPSLLCLFQFDDGDGDDDDDDDVGDRSKITNRNIETKVKLINSWKCYPTTFAKCFRMFNNCFAFLTSTDSDVIQLVNIELNVNIAALKLVSVSQEKKVNHGMVMSLQLFTIDTGMVPNFVRSLDQYQEEEALYIIIAYEDGTIILYRVSLKEKNIQKIYDETRQNSHQLFIAFEISIWKSHPEMVTCMDFNRQVMRGVSCSVNNEIALWSVNLPEVMLSLNADVLQTEKTGIYEHKRKRIKLINAGILCCVIRPDGRIFATGGKDGRVRLFALKSGKPLAILPFHSNAIECLYFSPLLANQSTKNSTEKMDHHQSNKSQSTIISNNNNNKYLLFASSRDKSISIWSLYNDDQ